MPFGSLWLPVVVSAVVVFVLSALAHMVLGYHKADFKALPNEEAVGEAMRKGGLAPGAYFMPYCSSSKQLKDPAVVERFVKGPVAMITVRKSGPPALGSSLVTWFAFCLLVSFTTAYVARHSLAPGTDGLTVLRVTGAVAFMAYGFSYLSDSIWHGAPWANTARALLDGLIYAVATGFVFRLMWPAA